MVRILLLLLLCISFQIQAQTTSNTVVRQPANKTAKGRTNVDPSNVYYIANKTDIDTENTCVLDSVAVFMKEYPSMVLEILSFTDGKEAMNKRNPELSQQRAMVVLHYLENKGIEKRRMTAKGYGDKNKNAREYNDDKTDNPEGRALNRRTEFRFWVIDN